MDGDGMGWNGKGWGGKVHSHQNPCRGLFSSDLSILSSMSAPISVGLRSAKVNVLVILLLNPSFTLNTRLIGSAYPGNTHTEGAATEYEYRQPSV